MSELLIRAEGLTKTFGWQPVLRGIDWSVVRGSCIALLGANGSGKTTLIRLLATLSRPSGGVLTIGGWSLPREAMQVRPHIGYLGHQPILYPDLTATENLTFFGRLYGANLNQIPALLERVGLAKRARDSVGTFSRGMQQRLGLARAILHQPDILLFDEPYTGLDVAGSVLLDTVIREQHAAGRTLIFTSHDLGRLAGVATALAVLQKGRLVYQGALPTDESVESAYQRLIGAP